LFTPGEEDSADEDSAVAPKSRKVWWMQIVKFGNLTGLQKKKKKAAPVVPESPRPPVVKNEKKAAKKAKARERKADKDEFDQALAELSVK
jgi:hypothetical protein